MTQEQDKGSAQPVAWMDDGSTGVNRNSEFRVVTDVTKQGMHASLAAKFSTPLYAAPQPNAALADGWQASLPDVEDMAHSALEEALSFGVSHDVFHRWMHAVRELTVAAMCNTAPPTLNASKGVERSAPRQISDRAAPCRGCLSTDCNGECMENL